MKKDITFRFSEDNIKTLTEYAEITGVTRTKVLETAIEQLRTRVEKHKSGARPITAFRPVQKEQ